MRDKKENLRLKRHSRIRLKILGNEAWPRLVIRRSLKNLHAQIIDDTKKQTILAVSTSDKVVRQKVASGGNIKAAIALGEIFSQQLKAQGINKIVFDRAGYLYHGRVKAFAEALRKGGLQF